MWLYQNSIVWEQVYVGGERSGTFTVALPSLKSVTVVVEGEITLSVSLCFNLTTNTFDWLQGWDTQTHHGDKVPVLHMCRGSTPAVVVSPPQSGRTQSHGNICRLMPIICDTVQRHLNVLLHGNNTSNAAVKRMTERMSLIPSGILRSRRFLWHSHPRLSAWAWFPVQMPDML